MNFRMLRSLAILFSVVTTASRASDGGWISGGGDGVAAEFVSMGYRIQEYLALINKEDGSPLQKQVSEVQFKRAVETTRVETKDRLELNGERKDAINYPELQRVEVARDGWWGLSEPNKLALVFHEYLGILKMDDSNYRITRLFLESMTLRPISSVLNVFYACRSTDQGSHSFVNFDFFNITEDTVSVYMETPSSRGGKKVWARNSDRGGDIGATTISRGEIYADAIEIYGAECGPDCSPDIFTLAEFRGLYMRSWAGPRGSGYETREMVCTRQSFKR